MLKTPILSNETLLSVDKDRGHVLYAGTKVLLTRSHQERGFLSKVFEVLVRSQHIFIKLRNLESDYSGNSRTNRIQQRPWSSGPVNFIPETNKCKVWARWTHFHWNYGHFGALWFCLFSRYYTLWLSVSVGYNRQKSRLGNDHSSSSFTCSSKVRVSYVVNYDSWFESYIHCKFWNI